MSAKRSDYAQILARLRTVIAMQQAKIRADPIPVLEKAGTQMAKQHHLLSQIHDALVGSDLIFDALTFPLSTGDEDLRKDAMHTIDAIRRIKAETFLDCISQVTETRNKFPGLPLGARAVQIADGAVTTEKLANGSVTTEKLADKSVTRDKLADNAVGSDQIEDGSITCDDIDPACIDAIVKKTLDSIVFPEPPIPEDPLRRRRRFPVARRLCLRHRTTVAPRRHPPSPGAGGLAGGCEAEALLSGRPDFDLSGPHVLEKTLPVRPGYSNAGREDARRQEERIAGNTHTLRGGHFAQHRREFLGRCLAAIELEQVFKTGVGYILEVA